MPSHIFEAVEDRLTLCGRSIAEVPHEGCVFNRSFVAIRASRKLRVGSYDDDPVSTSVDGEDIRRRTWRSSWGGGGGCGRRRCRSLTRHGGNASAHGDVIFNVVVGRIADTADVIDLL